ncbi:MAG: hypothetical protein ACXWX7_09580 [Candidatus Binatia bacterium]
MESMFLWIVLFSGATVLLLGLFLVASEKELKKKRGEINDLVTRLDGARTASAPASGEGGGNGAEVTGLRAKNQELKKEMALLQDDLEAAHRAIDELRSNQPALANGATLGDIAQLRNANSQLDAQVEELRRQLEESAAQPETASAADRGASERQTQLENALIDLKQQLEKSQTQVRQLESSPTPVVDASASEASHQEESQRLQARIAELEKDLSAGAEITRELDTLQRRIRESEKLESELRESLRRREEEIPLWQERIAASEEIKHRLLALQPVYDQLVAKQSSLIDHQRAYHGELKSFAQFLSASHDGTIAAPTLFDLQSEQETAAPAALLHMAASGNGRDVHHAATASVPTAPANEELTPPAKRGLGIFHALIALVVCGAMASLFWSQSGEQPVIHAAKPLTLAGPEKKAAPTPVQLKRAPAGEAVASTTLVGKANETAAAQPARQTKITPEAAAGTYEVTRSTRVFAAPTEFAQQLGEIEPGLKVNVVNARDGWLEIHSKHGRPPGYIRRDAVARVGG